MNQIIFPNLKTTNKSYNSDYIDNLIKTLRRINLNKIQQMKKIIKDTIKKEKTIFTCGNGGSASVSNHLLCDVSKGINLSNKKLKPKVISLSNSNELITAIGNDIKFEDIFSYQLEILGKKNDCLILFSSSGKSKNILKAIKIAKQKKMKIILISGFLGKIQKNLIHIDLQCKNYGITEDIFSSILHMISQNIRFEILKAKGQKSIL